MPGGEQLSRDMAGVAYTILFREPVEQSRIWEFYADLDRRYGWDGKEREFTIDGRVYHFSLGEEYEGAFLELEEMVTGLTFRPVPLRSSSRHHLSSSWAAPSRCLSCLLQSPRSNP